MLLPIAGFRFHVTGKVLKFPRSGAGDPEPVSSGSQANAGVTENNSSNNNPKRKPRLFIGPLPDTRLQLPERQFRSAIVRHPCGTRRVYIGDSVVDHSSSGPSVAFQTEVTLHKSDNHHGSIFSFAGP